ncbi:MAG: MFS transporter [Nitrospirae bacterium]|nr:MFS transporter [Nitrospirota bacterium]
MSANAEVLASSLEVMTRRQKTTLMVGVSLGIFLMAMESTVISTSMPTAIASLHRIDLFSWVFSAYVLSATLAGPVWGRLSDLYGKGRFYLFAIAIFITGSALCGFATTMVQLCVFRFLQGLGGGGLMPIGMTMVGETFPLEQRARLQGIISGIWGLASLVGPIIGGTLADLGLWRWAFFINIPLGALSAAVIVATWRGSAAPVGRPRLDLRNLFLFAASITLLVGFLLQYGAHGGGVRRLLWGMPVISAGLLVLFVRSERRSASPLIPLGLWRNRIFRAAIFHGFFSAMAMFGSLSFVPLFAQGVMKTTAMQAGQLLTPFILTWVFSSVISARLILSVGYRKVLIAGVALLAVGFLSLRGMDTRTTKKEVVGSLAVAGTGMGFGFVPMLIAVQSGVVRSELGIATSGIVFFRNVGATIGLSIMGAVMNERLTSKDPAMQGANLHELQLILSHNGNGESSLPPEARERLKGALSYALHGVFWIAFIASLLALPSPWMVPKGKASQLVNPNSVTGAGR